jgi:hypothetical protein
MKQFLKLFAGLSIFGIGYILTLFAYVVILGTILVDYGDKLWRDNGGKPL